MMREDRQIAKQCLTIMNQQSEGHPTLEQLDPRAEADGLGQPGERILFVPLREDDPTKVLQIGGSLSENLKSELISFLRSNTDVFSWSASDMFGISSEVITHQLKVDPTYRPIRQKKRSFAAER